MGPGVPVPACTFAPQASGTPTSDREDSRLYRTIFIRWGAELLCMMLLVRGVATSPASVQSMVRVLADARQLTAESHNRQEERVCSA